MPPHTRPLLQQVPLVLVETIVRGMGAVLFGVGGLFLGRWLADGQSGAAAASLYSLLPAAMGAAGAVLSPYLSLRPARWLLSWWRSLSPTQVALAVLGLVVGLITSALLAPSLTSLPGRAGYIAPPAAAFLLAILGLVLAMNRGPAMAQALGHAMSPPAPTARRSRAAETLILDTSSIIDGRIADVCQTGFIQGTLLIPRFVLDELRHVADSPEALRRNRGRRGLEVLTRLHKEEQVPIRIVEVDFQDSIDVDAKLVRLAASYGCPIVTNDFNLSQVAAIQGVQVLNINQLANAVKPVILPGEEMVIRIIQEGKELGQGVGFLDDGTMVVVEGGRSYLNDEPDIVVTRVLQTVAGRMIFAQLKAGGVRTLER